MVDPFKIDTFSDGGVAHETQKVSPNPFAEMAKILLNVSLWWKNIKYT